MHIGVVLRLSAHVESSCLLNWDKHSAGSGLERRASNPSDTCIAEDKTVQKVFGCIDSFKSGVSPRCFCQHLCVRISQDTVWLPMNGRKVTVHL